MNIYVGNIAYTMTAEELQETFAQFGLIANVKIITDKDSGKSKGYAFVEFETDEAAEKAISQMHDTQVRGRSIKVNRAHRKAAVV